MRWIPNSAKIVLRIQSRETQLVSLRKSFFFKIVAGWLPGVGDEAIGRSPEQIASGETVAANAELPS